MQSAPGVRLTAPVSELEATLRADLTAAMRARDATTTATLRMALAAITTEGVSGREARELTDADVQRVLAREAKKRAEAAEAFRAAGRTDSADAELAEREVLARYLPEPLGDDELSALVADAVAETGAGSPKEMGRVMGVVTPRVAGRAEGSRVAAEVKRQLAG